MVLMSPEDALIRVSARVLLYMMSLPSTYAPSAQYIVKPVPYSDIMMSSMCC